MALRLNTSEKNEIMPRRKARAEKPRLAQMLLRSGSLAGVESPGNLPDIPGQSGSPAALPGVFSQLPGSCLIGVSHFPYSGPEVLRSSFPGPSSSSHLGRDVSGPLSQR